MMKDYPFMQPEQKKPKLGSIAIMWKVLTIAGLILAMLIPLNMISGIIVERQGTKAQAEQKIADTWAGKQNLIGPILAIPYRTVFDPSAKPVQLDRQIAYILPQQYNVKGQLLPNTLYRGIYQSNVYTGNLTIEGNFNTKPLEKLKIAKENILWNEAHIVFGVSSIKGIDKQVILEWQGKPVELLPELDDSSFLENGLSANVPVLAGQNKIPFHMALSLKGSQSLSIAPIGKQSDISLNADWPSPSFIGPISPASRTITQKDFSAKWRILDLVRNYDQLFVNAYPVSSKILTSSIGVQLLTPVDAYRQSERAVKYGILFLVLTFATYFLFEVISSSRLHPFQYLLIGCAISLFYLLLIAISEVSRFEIAYGLASVAIISTITLYSSAILGRIRKHAQFIIGGLLTLLYSYLYILLQLEDQSLLFGSIGLFIVLAIIMYITRNIDWYNDQNESWN